MRVNEVVAHLMPRTGRRVSPMWTFDCASGGAEMRSWGDLARVATSAVNSAALTAVAARPRGRLDSGIRHRHVFVHVGHMSDLYASSSPRHL